MPLTNAQKRKVLAFPYNAGALAFKANNRVDIPHHSSISVFNAITFLVWMYPTSLTSTGSILIDKSASGVTNSYYLGTNPNGTPLFYGSIGGVTKNFLTSNQKVQPGMMNLVGFQYDGSTIKTVVYNQLFAGLSSTSLAATGAVDTNTSTLRYGWSWNGAYSAHEGLLARPRIWNRALTQDELDYLANNPGGHIESGCVLDHKGTDRRGTTVTDHSGYGNNGTMLVGLWNNLHVPGRDRKFSELTNAMFCINSSYATTPHSSALNLSSGGGLRFRYFLNTNGPAANPVVSKRAASGGTNYAVFMNPDGSMAGFNGSSYVTTTCKLPVNRLYDIFVKYGSGTTDFYVNGRFFERIAIGAGATNTNPLNFGTSYAGYEQGNGILGQVEVYSTAPSDEDIYLMHTTGKQVATNRTACFGFDTGYGTTNTDTVGGLVATLSSAKWTTNYSPKKRKDLINPSQGSLEVKNDALANTVVSNSNIGIAANGSFTMGCTAMLTGDAVLAHVLCGFESSPANPNIAVNNNGAISVTVPYTVGAVINLTSYIPLRGKFFRVAVSFNASTGETIIVANEKVVDRRTGTLLPFTAQKFRAGCHPGTGLRFSGFITDTFCYGTALTAEQMIAIQQTRVWTRTNLLLLWEMKDGQGNTVTDSSDMGNNGTVTSPLWSTNSPNPRRIQAQNKPYSLQMNGSNSVISKSSPTGLPIGTSPRSVITSMFFITDTVGCVVDLHVNGAQSFAPILGNLAGTYVIFSDRINAGNNLTMTSDEFHKLVGVGKSRRVVYTYDGATSLKLYVDGKLGKVMTLGVPLNTGTINTLLVASGQTAAQGPLYPFNGYTQDTIICNTELTPTEIADEFFTGKVPASAVTRIKTDEGTGTTAADSIGTNHCTITNATWSSYSRYKSR